MAITVKKAIKKIELQIARLSAMGINDRWFQDTLETLQKFPGHLPIDSPRLQEDLQ